MSLSDGDPARRTGICSVCLSEVPLGKPGHKKKPQCLGHKYRGGPCRGAGQVPLPFEHLVDTCSVCGHEKSLRKTDGRIVAHDVRGEKCEGSGKSPAGGRRPAYMNGQGASNVFSGGLPGLGTNK